MRYTHPNMGSDYPSPVPVPTTIRLRRDAYHAALGHRPLNHDWPQNIQHLWYACQAARAVVIELEMTSRTDPFSSGRPAELAQIAYSAWQMIEQYAAPIVAAMEA